MDFFIRHKSVVAFAGFTLFCLISLSLQSTSFVFSLEGVGSALVTPFQRVYDGIQGGISTFWAGFTDLKKVRNELEETRKKLHKYESISMELTEIKRENARLRRLLDMKARIEYDSVAASVISKDPDNWFRTIVINRGASDGIRVNMPVVAYQGGVKAVVGKITEVRGNISRVIPIISPSIRIGVKLQDSRFPGLLTGYSASARLCVIDYIGRAAIIRFGEYVITSGQAGIFPPGMLIGRVIKSDNVEASAYQSAVVKPVVDYNLLEQVFVITRDPDEELMKVFEEQE